MTQHPAPGPAKGRVALAGLSAFSTPHLYMAQLLRGPLSVADLLIPSVLRSTELAVAANLANSLAAASAVSAWRTSLITDHLALQLASSARSLAAPYEQIAAILQSTDLSLDFTDWITRLAPSTEVLRGISTPPLEALNSYLADIIPHPAMQQLQLARMAGHGINGLLATEILTGDKRVKLSGARERVEREVVQPWRAAPMAARQRLLGVLCGLDPELADLLDGAWARVDNPGPGAMVAIANFGVEVIDRTLRCAATDEVVQQWWAQTEAEPEVDQRGHPTRSARIRYILRQRKVDTKLVQSQETALTDMCRELVSQQNAAKHASRGSLAAVTAYLISTEAFLHQLFLPGN